ncbi:MAG TPA: virulence-associated E, partial [Thermoanaerobaculia bacterium]|nr:virulence-associated E [Thermoanaerobaculia bacterium]
PALSPSFSVESKAGPHNYWTLAPGAALDAFKPAQQQLSAFYGTDASVNDLPRVMRVPGFFHRKAEPFLVKFQPGSFRTYTLE